MVEEELAVAGAIALGADVVEAFQQRHQSVEVFQTDDVAVAEGVGLACRHTAHEAQKPCREFEESPRNTRTLSKDPSANAVPNGIGT